MSSTLFSRYTPIAGSWDELFTQGSDGLGVPRAEFARIIEALGETDFEGFARKQVMTERALLAQGVTFSVYADAKGTEKIFPFCLVPRLVSAEDWSVFERGLEQRIRALSLFLDDVYGEQKILQQNIIPREMVLGSKGYLSHVQGIRPPGGVRIHIAGIDLIRDPSGTLRVLEDNLRTPSGVSYVLENRQVSKRVLPRAFDIGRIRRVDDYPSHLAETLRSVAPRKGGGDGALVVLTPGPFNSAYFEHGFLARTMGVELVQNVDLFVDDDTVFMRTTRGPRRVDVIYRRTDESFIDPECFRSDSMLGVRGVMRAWAKGNVALANAPGNGVADDKAVYPFVHDMIRFYLNETPLLEQVPTWVCARPDDLKFVIEHLGELVVKAVDEAGGYGMLMGPQSTLAQQQDFREKILAEPRKYIAQRRVELSACPTFLSDGRTVAPRRVDLRPYILTGARGPWVLPGGLTRVALVEGSYVVNSSQGGGSKDTWVLR